MRTSTDAGPGGERTRRVRVRVEGVVQGVGFRPYVHRLAGSHGLGGFVLNDPGGVVVEVEGAAPEVRRFLERLPAELPPLAAVDRLSVEEVAPRGGAEGFSILPSVAAGELAALVPPDVATCDACLAELFDPADRRFRYPFVNCTDCGPRFTLVRGVPYDRRLTTMAGFAMCAACRAEYEDPGGRRFHAQPNACPDCGPRARLADPSGVQVAPGPGPDAVGAAADALRAGAVVAVKGVGGFHLACRADDEIAVRTLRRRKRREAKPFAVMVSDLAAARRLADVRAEEAALLEGRARPIVLVPARDGASLAASVAPGCRDVGLMLPYSPLHHLLLSDAGVPLVMTSGNASGEPVAIRDGEALERLAGIADLFLLHDRPIEARADDSVARVVSVAGQRRPLLLRRARGWVPEPLPLPVPAARPLVACGAQLKNTVCVAKGSRVWVGPHGGDLEDFEALRAFREGIDHLARLFGVDFRTVVHDLHPDYLSTRHAPDAGEAGARVGVQHHHAHLAACLAEHGETGPAVGAVFDGSGYGPDGTVWGGEILLGGLASCARVGHLWPVRLPGGEAAIREPWRMACAWLGEAAGEAPPLPRRLAAQVDPARWEAVGRLARSGLASPVTTSAGRLCDAVAALCGLRARVSYEGQAAMELEAAVDSREEGSYPLPALCGPGGIVLDARALVRAAAAELERGVTVAAVSARFHNGLADGTARACVETARRYGVETVALTGGVFQNVRLLERTAARVCEAGLRVRVPERLPPNDGGVSYGQAAVAAARGSDLADQSHPPGPGEERA